MDNLNEMKWQNTETELDLVQLFVELLKSIKAILICAVICALLLGGWKFSDGYRAIKRQQAELAAKESVTETVKTGGELDETAPRQHETNLEIYNAQAAAYQQQLDRATEEIARKEEYRRGSVLLNMNPQDFYQRTAVWYVDTHYQINTGAVMQNPNPLNNIISTYGTLLTSSEFYSYVQEHITEKIDARYIGELLLVKTDSGSALIQVIALGSTEQMANELCDAAKQYLELNYSQISGVVGNYDITLVENSGAGGSGDGSGTKEAMDAIIDAQVSYDTQLNALLKTVSDTQLKLSQLAEPGGVNSSANPDTTPIISMTTVKKAGIKNAVIGCLLGIVLAVIYIVIRFIAKDAALSEDELRRCYGVFILSSVKRFPGKGMWRRMLSKLSGDAKRSDTVEEAAGLAQANIVSILEADGQKNGKVLLVGKDTTALSEVERLVSDKNSDSIKAGGDIMTDKNAVETLRKYENVVVVERKEETSYREIGRELEKLSLLNKNVIGLIAL